MNPPVLRYLAADPNVAAMVSTRIYPHGEAPVNVALPYVTWFIVNGSPFNTLDSRPDRDRDTVQIDCWAAQGDPDTCAALAKAVLEALENRCHCTGMPIDGRDRETKNWRRALQFDFMPLRPPLASG